MKSQMNRMIRQTIASIIILFLSLTIPATGTTLLPNAKQTFFNTDGTLCVGCTVDFYIPGTFVRKDTWQDEGQTILNSNPLTVDSAGNALIYGSGAYRQILKDALGGTIWDQLTEDVTASGIIEDVGTSGGSANAQTVTSSTFTSTNGQALSFLAGFTNTNSMTLTVSGGAAIPVRKDTTAGPILMSGGEVVAGNKIIVYYDSGLGAFHLINNAGVPQLANANTFAGIQTFTATPVFNDSISLDDGPIQTPCGRLTLTTLTPVLAADVTAATEVFYTPYNCNMVPIYNGTTWKPTPFAEISQTLADATKSPSAGAVSQNYDMFVWNDAGTMRVSRGPTWATGGGSATARGTGAGSTELAMTNGVLMNAFSITNGPAANRGVYIGTISTSASGANGQLNMMFTPAAAAGGTANRLDVWNTYNRVAVSSMVRDSVDTYNYTTATVRAVNNSTSNRVTLVAGLPSDSVDAEAWHSNGNSSAQLSATGVCLDVTNAFSGIVSQNRGSGTGVVPVNNLSGAYAGPLGLGSHFLQWCEWSEAVGTTNWFGDNGTPTVSQNGMLVRWMN